MGVLCRRGQGHSRNTAVLSRTRAQPRTAAFQRCEVQQQHRRQQRTQAMMVGSFLLVRPLMVFTRFRMVFTKPAPMWAGMWGDGSRDGSSAEPQQRQHMLVAAGTRHAVHLPASAAGVGHHAAAHACLPPPLTLVDVHALRLGEEVSLEGQSIDRHPVRWALASASGQF